MAAVGLSDIQDTRKQQIKDVVAAIKNTKALTLNSFKRSSRTVATTESGYQIPYFTTNYTQNSAITPTSAGNSFKQSNPPETKSMWVGLAYNFKVVQMQGMLMNDLPSKQSLVNQARLRDMAIKEYFLQRNYAAINDGTGAVAYVTTVSAGTFTGVTAATTSPGRTKGAHRLQKNTVYDIVDESSFAVVGTITPSAAGTGSATVAVASTGTPNNANALVCEQGHYNLVTAGLGSLISNTARVFQGLDTTDYTEFNNSIIDLNGAAITSATVGSLDTKVNIRTGGEGLAKIGHITPGQLHTLAIQGMGARLYNADGGKADTSYGEPTKYEDRNIMWVADPDMDEDRVYLRNSDDYCIFEAMPFGPVKGDGLDWRQNPGANDVGAWEYFQQMGEVCNLGFDGDGTGSGDTSALVIRAAINDSQVNSY